MSIPAKTAESRNRLDHVAQLFADAGSVLRDMIRDRTMVPGRLALLKRRVPPRTPGSFRFPFGMVRFNDATALQGQYNEIFRDRIYDVDGISERPTIIDCGGNIGMSVIRFKQQFPAAMVAAFEADPDVAAILEYNVRQLKLKDVQVISAAVSDSIGTIRFEPDNSNGGHVGADGTLLVTAVRLSDMLTTPVDILKLDIEGSEFEVIEDLYVTGKLSLIQNILLEVHIMPTMMQHLAVLLNRLNKSGFTVAIRSAWTYKINPSIQDATPFPAVGSSQSLMHLYAWR